MYNLLTYSDLDFNVVEDRNLLYKNFSNYFYTRLLEMFRYENLPETIPQEVLEIYLLTKGVCFFTKVDDNFYVFDGSLGGEPDVYYRPTLFTVANPALNLSENYEISVDGILCKNDKLGYGLSDLIKRTAILLTDNIMTLHMSDINLRALMLLTAPDDRTKQSLEIFLKKLKDGELSVVSESQIFDGIKRFDANHSSTGYITQFIEYHQYILGSFYNEIGLNANFNMKRESIGKGEASLTEDTIYPLCDSMLETRQKFVEEINKMFNLDIKVDFSSIWKQNRIEAELELEQLKSECQNEESSSQLEKEGDNTDESSEPSEPSEPSGTTEENEEEERGEQSTEEIDETSANQSDEAELQINIQMNINNDTMDNMVDDVDNSDNSSQLENIYNDESQKDEILML